MEFNKECFVNLNIWACDKKHANRITDYVVQKPRRTRSISKYHFQHRYMIFSRLQEIRMQALSLYRLLSKFANSLDPEDLRRLAKSKQGQTGYQELIM